MHDKAPPPPRVDNSRTVAVVAVVGVLAVSAVLICGGVIAGAFYMVREAQEQAARERAQRERTALQQQALQQLYREANNLDHAAMLARLDAMLEQYPESADLHNNKAWLLATSPEDSIRDGQLAIKHARRACEQTDWSNAAYLDTLAAAYAEVGDFESAVEYQQQAVDHNLGPDWGFQQRLELFQSGQPYRER